MTSAMGWMVCAGSRRPEGIHHGGQPGHTFGDADQPALVGVPELLLLHPDGHGPHRRQNGQHNGELQRHQLEA